MMVSLKHHRAGCCAEIGVLACAVVLWLTPVCSWADPSADSFRELTDRLDQLVPALMEEHRTPGVSIAVIRARQIAWQRRYGVREAGSGERVNADTVFEAASMSKPLFAVGVMKLVEEGRIELDRPLVEYLDEPYLPEEPLHCKITARMVLEHTTGFPNWRPGGRRKGVPLPVKFEPGTKFGYSGEGFWYLQQVVEKLTGEPLGQWIERTVLAPLGMKHSSFAWRDDFATLAAAGHDAHGNVRTNGPRHRRENAAFTLFTTPTDYARFLIAMMPGSQSQLPVLTRPSLDAMLTPAIPTTDSHVYRSLGWVITKSGDQPFVSHSGSNRTGFRSYCRFTPAIGDGIVIMTNAVGGRQVWQKTAEAAW